jgi:hypothetical protein
MSYDKVIFKKKTLSDLFAEIYQNSKKKKGDIDTIIAEASSLIESTEDVIRVSPIIKDYLEVSVKNNEHLIKLAGIIQRIENSSDSESSMDTLFNPDELEKLLQDSQNTTQPPTKLDKNE